MSKNFIIVLLTEAPPLRKLEVQVPHAKNLAFHALGHSSLEWKKSVNVNPLALQM